MKILVTGAAGFIGFHTARKLLEENYTVIGIDSLNSYYDINLKKARLQSLQSYRNFSSYIMDISEKGRLLTLFQDEQFDIIIHLAAQAGVRYSFQNPDAYIESNMNGFYSILEACKTHPVQHLLYASSSSVYGNNNKVPFHEDDRVDTPVSLYAATKRSNELLAYTYSHLYGIPATGLRFFTVYGPWGRPDMAYYSFTKAIMEDYPIEVFNHGNLERDFTYIDDILTGILGLLHQPPEGQVIYNIGNNKPVGILQFIECLETIIGKKAEKIMRPMQPGDVLSTYADISALQQKTGFEPRTAFEEGLEKFVHWYREWKTH